MKRFVICTAGLLFALFSLCSCATTSDPSQGGFFSGVQGLSSGTYQNRVNQKQSNLDDLKQNGSELRAQQENLSQQSAALNAEERSYRRKLSHMRHDLARLQARLRNARVGTPEGQAKKVQLEKNLTSLKVRIRTQEQQGGQSEDEIQRQLAGLRQEKSRLEQDIVKLTSTQ